MVRVPVVVDVWSAPVDTAVPGGYADVLDARERARAAVLPRAAAARFVLGRLLLRGVLAGHLRCAPHEVVLSVRCPRCGGPHGQVRVVGPRTASAGDTDGADDVHVSLTRSGPVVAVALCTTGPVGIDAEARAAVGAAPLADVVLAPGELHRSRGRPRTGTLARRWVRTEAALKALGTGLTVAPSSVTLEPATRGSRGVDAVVAGSVAIADLRLGRGRAGAVAVLAPHLVRPDAGPGRPGRLLVRRYDGAAVLTARRS
ncbi:4'-phosphopantetheinyl transferase superfamily protein [uncultured Cellulomonas sp.]|uniref:4'-phosphopantetheinyl transferase family protein n=1 Tax=uncultured Cellulomonas sp. TaxID=189682 RepID=UPI002608FD41|nr:4'-phosphopantetheinyl transferase superfamily protein [uncultured Cellulomonas sp.]